MELKRKIYLVITPFFPEPGFFEGPYVMDQAKAIESLGDYKVVVIKPYPFYHRAADYEIYNGVVYRCPIFSLPSNLWPNRFCDWLSYRALKRKLRKLGILKRDVSVCHTHVANMGFYALALKKDNPFCISVVQHHGFDVFSLTDGKLAKFKWHQNHCIRYGRRICNQMDLNIGVSNKTLNCLKSYSKVKLKNEYVLYNGVDTRKFYPPIKPPQNKLLTIGCIANFWPIKDQMTLIKAVEQLVIKGEDNIVVHFIGTEITRDMCERYVNSHSLNNYFTFSNEVMHDQLLEFYQSLDLFVLPSYWEAFGCVYTEAFACGVPFIAVKGQGISELLLDNDVNNWLIDKGDYKELSHLIENFIKTRPQQKLSQPIDIITLINAYLKYIQQL